VTVLEGIYEQDFVGFSYGFRLGRGQHDALDGLHVGILRKRVTRVLDGRAPPANSEMLDIAP
jgi:RNA-directed DNA polymerase